MMGVVAVFLLLISVLVVIFKLLWGGKRKNVIGPKIKVEPKQEKSEAHIEHRAPSTYYRGGYGRVTKCTSCGMVSFCLDQGDYNPCRNCGGKVKRESKAAKWNKKEKQWIFSEF